MDVRRVVPYAARAVTRGGLVVAGAGWVVLALALALLLAGDRLRRPVYAPGRGAVAITPVPGAVAPPTPAAPASTPPAAPPPAPAPPVLRSGERPRRSPWDEPMPAVWPAVERWSDRMEREYAVFVEGLGRAVSERRCGRLPQCLRDPRANVLYDPVTDGRLALEVDCADLPYILRAYYAFKRRLPFGFVSVVRGRGTDVRYMLDVTPVRWHAWRDFRTPRALVHAVVDSVHSGMYRVRPEVENGDLYPVAMNRRSVRPGTVYYDPNGHVLTVAQVRPDGTVYLIDGHPDGSITWRRFGAGYAIGTRRLGGGFKNFRPVVVTARGVAWVPNRALADYDADAQYREANRVVDGAPAGYHAWVRASLAVAGAAQDPVQDFREQVRALCRDMTDRVEAVDAALAAGLHRRAHPGWLPWNIYGTTGDWETYSTPARDARFRASLREVHAAVSALAPDAPLRPRLAAAWREELARPECAFAYTDSAGARVPFTFDTVLDRLYALSFDPAHCPELRWGAPEGSPELAACPDDATKRAWYRAEQRLRNRIDREYGVPTPLAFGPEAGPDIDVRRALGLR